MTTEEMIRRYQDVLGQYDRTVLHDDDEAAQRLAEVSDTLIGYSRALIERLLGQEPDAITYWADDARISASEFMALGAEQRRALLDQLCGRPDGEQS